MNAAVWAKITTNTGLTWEAKCNATPETIVRYFLGNVFNVGLGLEDDLQTCVSVEINGQTWTL